MSHETQQRSSGGIGNAFSSAYLTVMEKYQSGTFN